MNKYPIDNMSTLRDVYHMWLIAVDPDEFMVEHGLVLEHLTKFRTIEHITWGEFDKARKEINDE